MFKIGKLRRVENTAGQKISCAATVKTIGENIALPIEKTITTRVFDESNLFVKLGLEAKREIHDSIHDTDTDSTQFSILLCIIFFLCKTTDPTDEIRVIFYGAYPGNCVNILLELFPKFKFDIYLGRDTEEKLLSMKQKIFDVNDGKFVDKEGNIINDDDILFTAGRLRIGRNINIADYTDDPLKRYFISNYRNPDYRQTAINSQEDHLENAKNVNSDMQLQEKLSKELECEYSLLNFRPRIVPEMNALLTAYNNEIDKLIESINNEEENAFTTYLKNTSDLDFSNIFKKRLIDLFYPDGNVGFDPEVSRKTEIITVINANRDMEKGFTYPNGMLFFRPFSKAKINSVFLITKKGQDEDRFYYDDEILTPLKVHNNITRKTVVYMNPYTGRFSALMPANSQYSAGCGFDDRVAFYILSLYFVYMNNLTKREAYTNIVKLFIASFTYLINNTSKNFQY